jgi:hypothetical protein
MPRLVDQPDELMGLELASSSDDSEDEDDNHVLDNVEAGLAEAVRPPKSTTARKVYSIFILILSMVVQSAGWYRSW